MIKKIIYALIIVFILTSTFFLLSKPPTDQVKGDLIQNTPEVVYESADLVFYWGDGCPHCETVQNWLVENNQQNTLKINSKEVYNNQENTKELLNTVNQYCPELKGDSGIGVPTAFDPVTQKCFQGSDEIINFLSDKLTN